MSMLVINHLLPSTILNRRGSRRAAPRIPTELKSRVLSRLQKNSQWAQAKQAQDYFIQITPHV